MSKQSYTFSTWRDRSRVLSHAKTDFTSSKRLHSRMKSRHSRVSFQLRMRSTRVSRIIFLKDRVSSTRKLKRQMIRWRMKGRDSRPKRLISRTRRHKPRWRCRELSRTSTRTTRIGSGARIRTTRRKKKNKQRYKRKCRWKTQQDLFNANGPGSRLSESIWLRRREVARKEKERRRRSDDKKFLIIWSL